jgi:excisionase family DNA binding protein
VERVRRSDVGGTILVDNDTPPTSRRTLAMLDVLHIRPTSIYKLSEVAADLDVSLRTLQRAVEAGKLTAVRAGRYSFLTGRSLLAWLEGRDAGVGKRECEAGEAAQV